MFQHDFSPNCLSDSQNPLHVDREVNMYTCPEGIIVDRGNYTWTNKTYNEGKIQRHPNPQYTLGLLHLINVIAAKPYASGKSK